MQSMTANPPTPAALKWKTKDQEARIVRIEAILKPYPQLVQQIRPDLDKLWERYRRDGKSLDAGN